MYLNAVFSNPTTQIKIFLPFMVMVCVEHDVAIPAVEFANVFCRNGSFLAAIDSPNLEISLKRFKTSSGKKIHYTSLKHEKKLDL